MAVVLPFTGSTVDLGLNVHVTPAGALQVRPSCPPKPPVLATVTWKLALAPTEMVIAVVVTDPVSRPTLSCIS
jgi:hypothetical protein